MRILVVEDDPALASGLRDGLVDAGFAVDVALQLQDAAAYRRVNLYDLIVLDLGLPDGDGRDFLTRVRERSCATPVLILTARGTLTDRVDGLNAGADDYLQKPFAFAELVARMRALLRRPTAALPPVLRVGSLELDPGRAEVRSRGSMLTLTVKERTLLEYLLCHRGQLVTRTMLLDHCWNDGYDGLSNLVDVHIGRLRRKLEHAETRCTIRTVRGAGFVLSEDDE
ncbi:MAG: response regulator transcription factor [Deltaproteobacteria bacterium]|nr:response regulator transcription factor [Deltaproteobacteria bacterium]